MKRSAELTVLPREHRADLAALRELGQQLSEHVRFEERVLFPRAEATVTPDELAQVGEQLRPQS